MDSKSYIHSILTFIHITVKVQKVTGFDIFHRNIKKRKIVAYPKTSSDHGNYNSTSHISQLLALDISFRKFQIMKPTLAGLFMALQKMIRLQK